MIGLVLVTHGRLAAEFRSALEHVVGPQKQIEAVTIGPDDDVEQRRNDIIEAVKRVDSGEGVAILTDMFGGTPSNLAISVMGRPKVEVLAGINLPMLVKLAKVRDECPLTEAVADFLIEHWQHHLVQTLLREGRESPKHADVLALADALIVVDGLAAEGRGAVVADRLLALQPAITECLAAHGHIPPTLNLGIPDRFIEHGSREDCLAAAGLDLASLESAIVRWWQGMKRFAVGG